jgi:hypothetical protein
MDYETEELLKCLLCKQRFDIPKLLPCGESVCKQCIENMCSIVSNKTIHCSLCDADHVVPDEGFPTQKLIVNMLNMQREAMCNRGSALLNQTVRLVDTAEKKIKNFMYNIKESRLEVHVYCEKMRKRIDEASYNVFMNFLKCNREMYEKVQQYEQKCYKNIDNNIQTQRNYYDYIQIWNLSISNWRNLIRSPDACQNAESLIQINSEVNSLLDSLDQEELNYERFVFDSLRISINQNENSDFDPYLIGNIGFESF